MRIGLFIVLASITTLFGTTSALYEWDGKRWVWKDPEQEKKSIDDEPARAKGRKSTKNLDYYYDDDSSDDGSGAGRDAKRPVTTFTSTTITTTKGRDNNDDDDGNDNGSGAGSDDERPVTKSTRKTKKKVVTTTHAPTTPAPTTPAPTTPTPTTPAPTTTAPTTPTPTTTAPTTPTQTISAPTSPGLNSTKQPIGSHGEQITEEPNENIDTTTTSSPRPSITGIKFIRHGAEFLRILFSLLI